MTLTGEEDFGVFDVRQNKYLGEPGDRVLFVQSEHIDIKFMSRFEILKRQIEAKVQARGGVGRKSQTFQQ